MPSYNFDPAEFDTCKTQGHVPIEMPINDRAMAKIWVPYLSSPHPKTGLRVKIHGCARCGMVYAERAT